MCVCVPKVIYSIFQILASLIGIQWYLITVWTCIFLMTINIEYLSIYLCASYTSSLVKLFVMSYAHLILSCVYLLLSFCMHVSVCFNLTFIFVHIESLVQWGSSLLCTGFLYLWQTGAALWLWSTDWRVCGLQQLWQVGSAVVAHSLSFPTACGVLILRPGI